MYFKKNISPTKPQQGKKESIWSLPTLHLNKMQLLDFYKLNYSFTVLQSVPHDFTVFNNLIGSLQTGNPSDS